jgi:UDP-N-acetyl-D-glucosamine dehydrogenase
VKPSKVVVIGQGYVGLPLALAIAEAGHKVVGFDLNQDLVRNLNLGRSHIEDVQDSDLENLIKRSNYSATSNPSDFAESDIAIIAVPTPLDSKREPDVSFVESASEILGKNLSKSALIINESTSYPGTLRDVIAPTVLKNSKADLNHLFAISPERVDPGNKDWKISNTPRIFAGLTDEATKRTMDFYSGFCSELIEVSSPEVAESAKLFENTFRQVNIALVNELALITRGIGISVNEVIDAAASKPYGFMKFNPSIGVGGHCIPVDPSYLAHTAKSVGVEPRFIELANDVNLQMPREVVKRVKTENSGTLSGKKILVCGVAYKPNVADTRESPTVILIEELEKEGARISWHDPLVSNWRGSDSVKLSGENYDVTIVAVLHDIMDKSKIASTSKYLFDCTGKMPGGHKL